MSKEHNQPWDQYAQDSWDQNSYRTGSTEPPKSRGGLIAVLLVAVILLGGLVSVLGLMNIRLFRQLNDSQIQNTLPFVLSNNGTADTLPEETGTATSPTSPDTQRDAVPLQPCPAGVENSTQEDGLSLQQIYAQTINSVVSISCTYRSGTSTGTGVILSDNGYVVTNCHVVEGAESIQVLLTDGRILSAALIGLDAISDLAVLQVEADGLSPAVLGDSASLRVGDIVVAIGDPLGVELRGTMTDGIVSAINRDIEVDGRIMSLIQTNAALNSGNSGGPLINCYGQVIGINTMKMVDTVAVSDVEGLGFAIPSSTVQEIVNQLIEQGYVSGRPSLGIDGEAVSSFYQYYYLLPDGLMIAKVESGSCAQKVGIAAGDILISIGGTRVSDMDSVRSVLYGYQPGDTVELIIYRSGRQYSVTVTLDEATG